MEEHSLFDHLVRELDSEERRSLLVRMQSALTSYPEELAPATEMEAFLPDEEARRLGFVRRVILVATALLTGKDRAHLLRELYLRRIGDQIRRHNPGLIDFRTGRFLDGMRVELSRLAEAGLFFRALLAAALAGGDGLYAQDRAGSAVRGGKTAAAGRRRAFVAFLARDELRDFQERLTADTDPHVIWRSLHGTGSAQPGGRASGNTAEPAARGRIRDDERRVREEMLARFERLVASIPQEAKRRLYRESGAMYGLQSLASFAFESLQEPFERYALPGGSFCLLEQLAPALRKLAESLSVVGHPPSPQSLYDLILYGYREQLDEEDAQLEERLRAQLASAREALEAIRRFHERVPLVAILRFVGRDPYYLPRVSGGGEDWFLLYQDFWRRRLQGTWEEFVRGRLRRQLEQRCGTLLGGRPLVPLDNYHHDKFGVDTPVRHSLSLAFLRQFHSVVFLDLHRSLKLIYLNGEFFREDNRREFTDAFHFFDSLPATIGALEARLGPSGDLRAAIQAIKDSEPLRRRQSAGIRDVLSRADVDAGGVAQEGKTQLGALVALLGGILRGRPGERYDSLANLTKLGGRENAALTAAWRKGVELFDRAQQLLQEILDLELA